MASRSKLGMSWLEDAVDSIHRRAKKLDNNPVEALTLKTLINIRLKDIAKMRKYLQKTESLTYNNAADFVELEEKLASALSRCTLCLDDPLSFEKYRK